MRETVHSFKKANALRNRVSVVTRCLAGWGLNVQILAFVLFVVPMGMIGIYMYGEMVASFMRPLWEKQPKAFLILPHYYHENVSMESLCKLHGWGLRESPRRVIDAVLFNNEVDMLTIRWKELSPYATKFVLLESNSTFTGLWKPSWFAATREKFNFVEDRLTYATVRGRFRSGENPFVEEAYQRRALDQLIRLAGINDDDLLIMSDVDEIPSGHTINLLRWCDEIPPILHLQLREYLYSFEYFIDNKSWRASVHRYRKGQTRYAHYRQSDLLFAESGWHCSFCFRNISEFIFKMKAYSHNDRVKHKRYLSPQWIQTVICQGTDLFEALPEEYTFKEIIGKMGPIPRSHSAVHLPLLLLTNADRYKYLLPGNCMRGN